MKKILHCITFSFLCLSLHAETGDTLYVSEGIAKIRNDPSENSKVIILVSEGHTLLELSNRNLWVEVGLPKTDGKTGWILKSTTTRNPKKKTNTALSSDSFNRFEKAFWTLAKKIEKQTGITFFENLKYEGDGIVRVYVSQNWQSGTYEMKEGNLKTIYNMWEASEGLNLPVAVYICDTKGRTLMKQNHKK